MAEPRSELAGGLVEDLGIFIDGEWHEPQAGRFDDLCPTTEEVIASVPDASTDQMSQAIDAARRSVDAGTWSQADPSFRAACLTQLGDALSARRDDVIALSRVEWGNSEGTDFMQVDSPAFMAYGGAQKALVPQEEEIEAAGATGRVLLRHEPVGVVSVLTPWNFPHTLNMMKLTAALAAGNSLILKPSPLTPMIGLALGKLIDEETDIHAGVVNIVTTSSLEASQLLVTDPRVDMVSFTGSSVTGRSIMSMASPTLKRLLLELGGKSAAIFLDGVDFDAVLPEFLFEGCTLHAGQACILKSRLIVHRSVHDEVLQKLAALASHVVVGDPLAAATTMGPLISADQRDRVEALVNTAVAEGATLVTGGGRPSGLGSGYFFEPTVLGNVAPDSIIAQTEAFGPVLSVIPYDSVDEALSIANNSIYGLVGSVYGADNEQALNVARQMRTGQVVVNGASVGDSPFGGFKQSGIGREGGVTGLRQYTETKAIGTI